MEKEKGFTVVAGKYEHDDHNLEMNYKYIGPVHATMDEALADFQTTVGYPFRFIEYCDGKETWQLDPRLMSDLGRK